MHKTGELIAIQAENGEVFLGFVSEVHPEGTYDLDLIADKNYRSKVEGKTVTISA